MTERMTYADTAAAARAAGASLVEADAARFYAMSGAVDGRLMYDAARFTRWLNAQVATR